MFFCRNLHATPLALRHGGAVIDCVPFVTNVTENVCVPALLLVKLKFAGSAAAESELLKRTVPL